MLRRLSIAAACAAAAIGAVPVPADAVDATGCMYTREQKFSSTYEEGILRMGPVVHPGAVTVEVQCTLRLGAKDGLVLGTIGGSLVVGHDVTTVSADSPVGVVVEGVYIRYPSAPAVGTQLYGCLTSSDGTSRYDHGCSVAHVYR